MNRIDRISAILIQLQTKKIVRACEIADRFAISLRTVYRDMKALEEAGVPIGAEAGRGYYIVDGYHLPPVMFTREEAGSIIIGEKLVDKFTDDLTRQHFTSAVYKIKSILPARDKDYLENMHRQIQVLYSSRNKDQPNHFIPLIQQAIAEQRVIQMDYKSQYKNELTKKRHVEPLWLCFYSFAWHLIGWCRVRNSYRDFRTDRIMDLQILDETYQPRDSSPLHEFLNTLWKKNELLEAVILVDTEIAPTLQNTKYYFGFVGEKQRGNKMEMKFAVDDYEYFNKWLLTLGNRIEIVSPKKLRGMIKKMVKELAGYYNVIQENPKS